MTAFKNWKIRDLAPRGISCVQPSMVARLIFLICILQAFGSSASGEDPPELAPHLRKSTTWHCAKLASIPRLNGQFLWSQVVANKKAGADMLYIAMFDEVDEATAIFKCTNNPPTSGGAKFLKLDGLPSDFYLRLAGQAGKLLRDEIPLSTTVSVTR